MEAPAVVGISLLEEFEGDEELGSGCFSGAHRVLVAQRDELLIMGFIAYHGTIETYLLWLAITSTFQEMMNPAKSSINFWAYDLRRGKVSSGCK